MQTLTLTLSGGVLTAPGNSRLIPYLPFTISVTGGGSSTIKFLETEDATESIFEKALNSGVLTLEDLPVRLYALRQPTFSVRVGSSNAVNIGLLYQAKNDGIVDALIDLKQAVEAQGGAAVQSSSIVPASSTVTIPAGSKGWTISVLTGTATFNGVTGLPAGFSDSSNGVNSNDLVLITAANSTAYVRYGS